jgi:hypothetical protein
MAGHFSVGRHVSVEQAAWQSEQGRQRGRAEQAARQEGQIRQAGSKGRANM